MDELFMWVSTNRVVYADPWTAADLLHKELGGTNQEGATNTIWCGWTTNSVTNTVGHVAMLNRWGANLPFALDGTTNDVTVTFGGDFPSNTYLRVNNEIMRVKSVTGYTHVLERALGGRPAMPHAERDVLYALSPLLVKNLIDTNGVPCVASRITSSLNQLKAGLGNYNAEFIPVPVLFNDGYHNPQEELLACTANLANCLMVKTNEVYYSDPGNEAFRNYFKTNVVSGAVAVNVWEHYHCKLGEIHCGTAVRRQLPVTPPWWEHNVIKNEWRDEK